MCWSQHRLDELIQPVEVDVGKDWADHTALRGAAQRRVIFPVLQVTCVEQVGEQPQEALIVEFLAQDRQQDRVVDAVETLRYVSLDEPLDPSPVLGDLSEGGVATSIGTEPVGVWAELGLVVGVQRERTTSCSSLSDHVGIPSGRNFPDFLGMYVRRTGVQR